MSFFLATKKSWLRYIVSMNLIQLTMSPEKVKEYNDRIDHCKAEYGDDFQMEKISGIESLIPSYQAVLDDPNNKDVLSDVKDTLTDFTGVYYCDQFDWIVKDFVNEKLIDDSAFNIDHRFDVQCYGVCDNASQVIEYYRNIEKERGIDLGDCIICLRPIVKKWEPPRDGWRWHKWGPYIGVKHPTCEYIYDEGNDIQMVWCFHIHGVSK